MREGQKSYLYTKRVHATMLEKQFIPLYLEHLLFLIRRAGWKVAKIYAYYTFDQGRFKRDFILMNQRSRQQTKKSVEKDFFKLLNNANFGYGCRNNIDNCKSEPIRDEINEISYIRQYTNLLDKSVSEFLNSRVIAEKIEDIVKIDPNGHFRNAEINALHVKRQKNLNAVELD